MSEKKEIRLIEYSEVAKHNTKDDCWVIVNDQVFDLTEQKKYHPVGESYISMFAGKDATWLFKLIPFHNKEVKNILQGCKVGNFKRVPGQVVPDNKTFLLSKYLLIVIAVIYYFVFW